jgi:hypothetical protein
MDVSKKARETVLNRSSSSKLAEGVSGVLTTNRKICAVNVDGERNRLGAISHIPPGSRISICGDGFNERTVKISWQDELYVVFREDVDIRTTAPASGSKDIARWCPTPIDRMTTPDERSLWFAQNHVCCLRGSGGDPALLIFQFRVNKQRSTLSEPNGSSDRSMNYSELRSQV